MNEIMPNSITVLNSSQEAVDTLLKKVLKFKGSKGATIILDYTGRGAMTLSTQNKMGLLRRPIHWLDLADRMKPITLFSLARSEYFHRIIGEQLHFLRKIAHKSFKDSTIKWVTEAAYVSDPAKMKNIGLLKMQ